MGDDLFYREENVRISERRWQRIKKLSSLPDDARPEVESAIINARKLNSGYWLIHRTVSDLQASTVLLRAALLRAQKSLKYFNSGFGEKGTTDDDMKRPEFARVRALREVAGAVELLDDNMRMVVAQITDTAQKAKHVLMPKRGPRPNVPYFLVAELDRILHHFVGRGIFRKRDQNKRGDKDWIDDVCQIADPKIGPGQIDSAMKWVVRKRRSQRTETEQS